MALCLQVSHNPREEAGEVDVAAGRAAAHACALNLLSVMKEAAGSLDKVVSSGHHMHIRISG